MDDSLEKLRSLKSLDDRLVKETLEKRMEVGELVQTKEALELDLKRNVDEKEQVMGELSDARDSVYGLELERNVICVDEQSQMEEIGGGNCGLVESEGVEDVEIGRLKAKINELILTVEEEREKWRVCCERDGIKVDFDVLVERTGYLRGKLIEMKEYVRRALEVIEYLRGKCEKLLGKCMILNGTLMKGNELVQKLLDESSRVIEDLERKVDLKMEEKVEIEKEKNGLEMEIEKLEKEQVQLKESTFCFKQEKEEDGKRISELQKRIEEAVEKENSMLMDVDVLVKELQKKEKYVEMLTQQRISLEVILNQVQEEVENLRRTIEIFNHHRVEMEEVKMQTENIIGVMQRGTSKFIETLGFLTKMSDGEKARDEELLPEICRLQDALDEVTMERDDARKGFGDEKRSVKKLSLLLRDKERRIEEEAMNDNAKISQEEASLNVKKGMEKRRP